MFTWTGKTQSNARINGEEMMELCAGREGRDKEESKSLVARK